MQGRILSRSTAPTAQHEHPDPIFDVRQGSRGIKHAHAHEIPDHYVAIHGARRQPHHMSERGYEVLCDHGYILFGGPLFTTLNVSAPGTSKYYALAPQQLVMEEMPSLHFSNYAVTLSEAEDMGWA